MTGISFQIVAVNEIWTGKHILIKIPENVLRCIMEVSCFGKQILKNFSWPF